MASWIFLPVDLASRLASATCSELKTPCRIRISVKSFFGAISYPVSIQKRTEISNLLSRLAARQAHFGRPKKISRGKWPTALPAARR